MAISNNSTGLRPGVCTSSTRPTAPYEGQHIYETDTDIEYVWNGSAWVVNYVSAASPAFTGTPTAPTASAGTNTTQLATTAFVTAADALAGGLVLVASATFTTASTCSINNCFTSTYENYKVVISGFSTSSTSANILMRFRNAGTDRATQYQFAMRGLDAGNTSKDDYGGGYGTFGFFGSSPVYAGDVTSSTWDVYTPATSNRSYITFTTAYYPGAFAIRTGMIAHDSTVSNDGFTVWPTNGTASGNIRVYGYRN